jgi:citrate lyase subunit beta/citryl-CoA lyase
MLAGKLNLAKQRNPCTVRAMGITNRPLRSVLYVPADRERAVAKVATLGSDAVIFDLEDAVAPDAKANARETLRGHFRDQPSVQPLRVIRINGFETPWGTEDFLAARSCRPDAILLPKVGSRADLDMLFDALEETDAPPDMQVWAMIETPRGVANCAALAQSCADDGTRLACLVAGTNDLFKETGLCGPHARHTAQSWLMQIVLGARCGGLAVLDGVFNDHSDGDGFDTHCTHGVAMGFDGVTLIHPAQTGQANRHYAPSAEAIADARQIVEAFQRADNAAKGVIALDGRMVERLHLEQAEALLEKARMMGDNTA